MGEKTRGQEVKPERRTKNNQRSSTVAELEAILEQLMLEVAGSFPRHRYSNHEDALKPWAHMTAMYVSEVVKRRNSPRETIIRNAQKAVRRRIERELADSYLGMVLPGREEGLRAEPTPEEEMARPVSGEDSECAGDGNGDHTVPDRVKSPESA